MAKKNKHTGSALEDFLKEENIDLDLVAQIRTQEKSLSSQAVMDLYFSLKEIKGKPTLRDLVKLAQRIKGDSKSRKDKKS